MSRNLNVELMPRPMFGLASHTFCRKEEFGHSTTIELLPQQKVDVTNEICILRGLHPLSWSSNYVTKLLVDVRTYYL